MKRIGNLEEEGRVDGHQAVGKSSDAQLDETQVHGHDEVPARGVAHHAHALAGPTWKFTFTCLLTRAHP